MSSWGDAFEGHAVWRTLEEVRDRLRARLPEDEGDRDTVEYARATVERVAAYKQDADPLAFTPDTLAAVDTALRELLNRYADWQNEGQTGNADVDVASVQVIQALAQWWPSLSPKQTEAAAKKTFEALSQAATQAIEAVSTKRDEMDESLTAINGRINDLSSQLEAVKSEATKQVGDAESAAAASLAAWAEDAEKAISELRELRTEAQNMVHDTTAATVGAEYANYSDEKRKLALKYDIAAVVFGSAGLISLAVYLWEKGTTDSSAALAITRIGITVGASVIGGFLAARGNEQHKEAKAARRTALALSRLGPFVANLPKDAREVLIIETADRIFTKGELTDVSERGSVLAKLEAGRAKRRQEARDAGVEE